VILSAWLSFKSCDHSPFQELSQYALAEASEAVFTFLPHTKNQEGDNRQLWTLFLGSNRIGDLFFDYHGKKYRAFGDVIYYCDFVRYTCQQG